MLVLVLIHPSVSHATPPSWLAACHLLLERALLDASDANGGRVYRDGLSVKLLVDIKGDVEATHEVLRRQLAEYTGMFTRFECDTIHTNGVTVILSGKAGTVAAPSLVPGSTTS